MKIKFIADRILGSGQKVSAGEELDVSDTEGEAFIKNRVAVAVVIPPKKTKED
jgi:hypothetical protein